MHGRAISSATISIADNSGGDILEEFEMTKERLLAALDKPRKINSVLAVVNPGGSEDEVQNLLMEMRDEGLVKFDIHKGQWSRA